MEYRLGEGFEFLHIYFMVNLFRTKGYMAIGLGNEFIANQLGLTYG